MRPEHPVVWVGKHLKINGTLRRNSSPVSCIWQQRCCSCWPNLPSFAILSHQVVWNGGERKPAGSDPDGLSRATEADITLIGQDHRTGGCRRRDAACRNCIRKAQAARIEKASRARTVARVQIVFHGHPFRPSHSPSPLWRASTPARYGRGRRPGGRWRCPRGQQHLRSLRARSSGSGDTSQRLFSKSAACAPCASPRAPTLAWQHRRRKGPVWGPRLFFGRLVMCAGDIGWSDGSLVDREIEPLQRSLPEPPPEAGCGPARPRRPAGLLAAGSIHPGISRSSHQATSRTPGPFTRSSRNHQRGGGWITSIHCCVGGASARVTSGVPRLCCFRCR